MFLLARDGSEQTPLPQGSFSTSLGSQGSISHALQGRFGLQNASSDREEQPELPLGLFSQLQGLRPALQKMGSDRGLSVLGKLPVRFCSCLYSSPALQYTCIHFQPFFLICVPCREQAALEEALH